MITEVIAKTLDSAGNGIGAVFAHFKIGAKLKVMSERLKQAEKKIDELENKLSEADKDGVQ